MLFKNTMMSTTNKLNYKYLKKYARKGDIGGIRSSLATNTRKIEITNALIEASACGKTLAVQYLLNHGANINAYNQKAVVLALNNMQKETSIFLLNQLTSCNSSVLENACKNDVDIFNLALSKYNGRKEYYFLNQACYSNNIKVAKILLENKFPRNCSIQIATNNNNTKLVNLLLQYHISNKIDKRNVLSAIHNCAHTDKYKIIEILLNKVKVSKEFIRNILKIAISQRSYGILDFLLRKYNISLSHTLTPRFEQIILNNSKLLAIFEKYGYIKYLNNKPVINYDI